MNFTTNPADGYQSSNSIGETYTWSDSLKVWAKDAPVKTFESLLSGGLPATNTTVQGSIYLTDEETVFTVVSSSPTTKVWVETGGCALMYTPLPPIIKNAFPSTVTGSDLTDPNNMLVEAGFAAILQSVSASYSIGVFTLDVSGYIEPSKVRFYVDAIQVKGNFADAYSEDVITITASDGTNTTTSANLATGVSFVYDTPTVLVYEYDLPPGTTTVTLNASMVLVYTGKETLDLNIYSVKAQIDTN